MNSGRVIPIVMAEGALSAAARAHATEHSHAADASRPLPGPAPAFLSAAGRGICEAEIAQEMQHHRAASPQQSRLEAARALVVRELLRAEIARLGITAEPEGRETSEEAAIRVLLEREVATPTPDEEQCRNWFERNRERLHQPDRIKARHILLAAAPGDIAARTRAAALGETLISELLAHPERFCEFAMRHSACSSRDQGGELGWIERGETTPEFERQLFMLRVGLAGLTVESRWGHHVVSVDEIERGAPLSFEEAQARIASYLETQVRQNAIHQYLQILRERHGVQGLDELEATAVN